MDYKKEAKKLVSTCHSLEEEYLTAFKKRDLAECERLARLLEKIDPNCNLQVGFTSSLDCLKKSKKDRLAIYYFNKKKLIAKAVKLLKQEKLKPLK